MEGSAGAGPRRPDLLMRMIHGNSMRRVHNRFADTICALIAFFTAYTALIPSRYVVQKILPLLLENAAFTSMLIPDRGAPSLWELSWIMAVSVLAINLTLEYGEGLWLDQQ